MAGLVGSAWATWAAQVQSSTASLFGLDTFSDCTLEIVQEGATGASTTAIDLQSSEPKVYHSVPAHRMALHQSEYFRSRMQRWSHDSGTTGTGSQQLSAQAAVAKRGTKRKANEISQPAAPPCVLRVPVASADDAASALEVVEYMYKGRLKAVTASALLAVRQQADYLAAQHCITACDEALACLQLSWADAVAVYSLAAGPGTQTDAMRKVLAGALQAVLKELGQGCALATYTTPVLLQKWRQLPQAAVEAVLASDELRTDSEVCGGGVQGGRCEASSVTSKRQGHKVYSKAAGCAINGRAMPPVTRVHCCAPRPPPRILLGTTPHTALHALPTVPHLRNPPAPQATVLMLLAHWVEAHLELAGDDAVMERLCGHIRASQLPRSYVRYVLVGLPWFHITTLQQMDLLTLNSLGSRLEYVRSSVNLYADQPGWFRPARPPPQSAAATSGAATKGPQAQLSAMVDRASVEGLINRFGGQDSQDGAMVELVELSLQLGYSKGYDWSARVQLEKKHAEPAEIAGAGLYFSMCPPQILRSSEDDTQQQHVLVGYEAQCGAVGKAPGSGRARVVGYHTFLAAAKCNKAGSPSYYMAGPTSSRYKALTAWSAGRPSGTWRPA